MPGASVTDHDPSSSMTSVEIDKFRSSIGHKGSMQSTSSAASEANYGQVSSLNSSAGLFTSESSPYGMGSNSVGFFGSSLPLTNIAEDGSQPSGTSSLTLAGLPKRLSKRRHYHSGQGRSQHCVAMVNS